MTTSKTTRGTQDYTIIKKLIVNLQENKNSISLELQVIKWHKILVKLTKVLYKSSSSIGSNAFNTLLAKHNISYDKNELQKADELRHKIAHCVLYEVQSHNPSLFLDSISIMESICCSLILCKYEHNTEPPKSSKKKKRNKRKNNKKKKEKYSIPECYKVN